MSNIPRHIAIIMDGNGRWAQSRGFGRTRGHREGAKRVDDVTTECVELGVRHLTLYAFSTENWNRPKAEVTVLMRLLVNHLRTMDKKLLRNGVSLAAKGSLERLPDYVRKELARVIAATARPDPKMTLHLCLSYGGRQEIVDAARRLAERAAAGTLAPAAIDEATFREALYEPQVPDPDLMIRTGGEYRVSNFLLWQIAYAELVTSPVLWPDFNGQALRDSLGVFATRQRRFGLTGDQVASKKKRAPLSPLPAEHSLR
jgi:undecaprenyl diphosphate synthase